MPAVSMIGHHFSISAFCCAESRAAWKGRAIARLQGHEPASRFDGVTHTF
jgi:hypothetical protein